MDAFVVDETKDWETAEAPGARTRPSALRMPLLRHPEQMYLALKGM